MNDWKKPAFEEISMNAEIGAYQPDTDDPRAAPPVTSNDLALIRDEARTASHGD